MRLVDQSDRLVRRLPDGDYVSRAAWHYRGALGYTYRKQGKLWTRTGGSVVTRRGPDALPPNRPLPADLIHREEAVETDRHRELRHLVEDLEMHFTVAYHLLELEA